MKQIGFILLLVLLCVVFVAAEAPPSVESQQFSGTVTWDKSLPVPKQVIVKTTTKVYSSVIKAVPCVDVKCTGKYGEDAENILRVQAGTGEKLGFYVDTTKILEKEYTTDAVTVVDLELKVEAALVVEPKVEEKAPEPVAGPSSGGSSSSSKKSSSSTNNGSSKLQSCTKSWVCGQWSSCVASSRTRSCIDEKDCDELYASKNVSSVISGVKPKEVESCVMPLVTQPIKEDVVLPSVTEESGVEEEEVPVVQKPKKTTSCSDGLKNQNEEDVDCGGVCKACEGGVLGGLADNLLYYIIGIVVLIGLGVGVYFFMKSREGGSSGDDVELELTQVYNSGEAKGLSDSDITSRLVAKGWDEAVLDKFLRGR